MGWVYVYGVVRVYGVCVYSVGSLGGCGVCVKGRGGVREIFMVE